MMFNVNMIKSTCALVFLLLMGQDIHARLIKDSITVRLNIVTDNRNYYESQKKQEILNLKKIVRLGDLNPVQQFKINLKLYEAYKKYKVDSAVFYVLENKKIADDLSDQALQNQTNVQLATLYSTKGLYIESKALLDRIDRSSLSKELLPDYYESYIAFCSHYGQSNNDYTYYQKSEQYRDSLLSVLPTTSLKYLISKATKTLYSGERDKAETELLSLLDRTSDKDPDRALIAYLLGIIYRDKGTISSQLKYFSISSITDMVNSIKDNASMKSLALTLYNLGDIDKANKFIELAINDAVFCNVRYRTVESSSLYAIINSSFQEKEHARKRELIIYLTAISVLSVALVIGIIGNYRQMKKLSRTRKALYDTNEQLNKLNSELKKANDSLFEANHIKEEYIANFFDLCSTYIEKLDRFKTSVQKKLLTNNTEGLLKELKSTDLVENELDELFKNFDSIFLNLYPSFVVKFNSLLLPEEQIHPKPGELLNTELRIFALIRLGITDSVKIANFLRYSLRTIYNYRTKVRSKAAVSRDEFENCVKEIGTIRSIG